MLGLHDQEWNLRIMPYPTFCVGSEWGELPGGAGTSTSLWPPTSLATSTMSMMWCMARCGAVLLQSIHPLPAAAAAAAAAVAAAAAAAAAMSHHAVSVSRYLSAQSHTQ